MNKDDKKCKFCNSILEYVESEFVSTKSGLDTYICDPCSTGYHFFSDGTLATYTLYTHIKEKVYCWTISNATNQSWIRFTTFGKIVFKSKLEMKNFRDLATKPLQAKLITVLSQTPDVNPKTIKKKLKYILLFL
jgi:hypothetical protein